MIYLIAPFWTLVKSLDNEELCTRNRRGLFLSSRQKGGEEDQSPSPTSQPTSAPTSAPTEPVTPLHEAILADLMPKSSNACTPVTTDISFTFESSQATSQWKAVFTDFEQYLFLAKMEHQDANENRTWTMRFGQAGNIYSLYGPMGETVPPQDHDKAPWVDEVWQQVQPLGNGGDHDQNSDTEVYFIHEAGVYQKDSPYTDIPFYSPTLGKACSGEKGECGFISWVRLDASIVSSTMSTVSSQHHFCSFLILVGPTCAPAHSLEKSDALHESLRQLWRRSY